MSDILNFISKDSSISMTFEMYEAMLYMARAAEQERIIKLLEAECQRPQDPKWEHYRESCYCCAIDIIKGEQ